jgi:hypothetical protein
MTDPVQVSTAAFAGELARYRAVKACLAAALATPCRGAGGPRVDPVLGPEIHVAEDELAEATQQLAEAVARAADQAEGTQRLLEHLGDADRRSVRVSLPRRGTLYALASDGDVYAVVPVSRDWLLDADDGGRIVVETLDDALERKRAERVAR